MAMMKRVSFAPKSPGNNVPMPKSATEEAGGKSSVPAEERRAIAKAKTKYSYPWWASDNPLEVFWGQLNEETLIVPIAKFLEVAKQAMGRQVFKQEFADRQALMDELVERISAATISEVLAKIPTQRQAA